MAIIFWHWQRRKSNSKSKLYYDRQSVGQSVLASEAPISDPWPIFPILSFLLFFLDSFRFVDVGRPLWREIGCEFFSFCRESPAQPFSDLNPTGLTSIFYCLYFWDSLNLERQVPVVISPRNRVAQLYPRALGQRRKRLFRYLYIISLLWNHDCLRSRYLAMVVV
jgi:hypothetical protein